MRDFSDRNAILDWFHPFEVLVRKFESVVPKCHFSRPHLLSLFPGMNSIFRSDAAGYRFVDCLVSRGKIGMRLGSVRYHHFMTALGMLEEIENSFLLH